MERQSAKAKIDADALAALEDDTEFEPVETVGSIESYLNADKDVDFNFKAMAGECHDSMFEAISYQLYGF
jgi:hypothetical protein